MNDCKIVLFEILTIKVELLKLGKGGWNFINVKKRDIDYEINHCFKVELSHILF